MRKEILKKVFLVVFLFILLIIPTVNIEAKKTKQIVKNPVPSFEGYKHVKVKGNYAFILSTFESNWHDLKILNVSDTEKIQFIVDKNYTDHSYAYEMHLFDNFLFLQTHNQIQIYDVSNIMNITKVNSIAVNNFMPYENLAIKDNILFHLVDNFNSEIDNIQVINYYNITDINNIVHVGNCSITTNNNYQSILISGSKLLAIDRFAGGESKILSIDIANVSSPVVLDTLAFNENFYAMECNSEFLYLAVDNIGLIVIDLDSLTIVNTFDQFKYSQKIKRITIKDNLLFLATDNSIALIDIEDVQDFSLIFEYIFAQEDSLSIQDIEVEKDLLYLVRNKENEEDALIIFNYSSLEKPIIIYPEKYETILSIGFNYSVFYWLSLISLISILQKVTKFSKKSILKCND